MANYTPTARAFAERTGPATAGNLAVTAHEAWTYRELLARVIGPDSVQVNMQQYSTTSSAHRNAIIRELEAEGYRKDGPLDGRWQTYTR